jgi:hypothetical protein
MPDWQRLDIDGDGTVSFNDIQQAQQQGLISTQKATDLAFQTPKSVPDQGGGGDDDGGGGGTGGLAPTPEPAPAPEPEPEPDPEPQPTPSPGGLTGTTGDPGAVTQDPRTDTGGNAADEATTQQLGAGDADGEPAITDTGPVDAIETDGQSPETTGDDAGTTDDGGTNPLGDIPTTHIAAGAAVIVLLWRS